MPLERLILESRSPLNRRLQVAFEWREDRYAHRIALAQGDRVQSLLASIEGIDSGSSPPSPPLQQLHLEDRPNGSRVALLVGMAGRNHWSLSVEIDAEGQNLWFDAACRRNDSLVQLSSTYEAQVASLQDPVAEVVRLQDPMADQNHNSWAVTTSIAAAEGAARLTYQAEKLVIHPVRLENLTVRWKYRIAKEAPRNG